MTYDSLTADAVEQTTQDLGLDDPVVMAVERLLAAGIGMTAWAIGRSPRAATLTIAQWRVLVLAARIEGLRVGEIAARLGMSQPSASRLVRRLEARDLVRATRSPDDRRATVVTLTNVGQALVRDVMARRQARVEEALRDRPRSGEQGAAAIIEAIAARVSEFV
jgi:DNA-binding MarR family transcriptional regulator